MKSQKLKEEGGGTGKEAVKEVARETARKREGEKERERETGWVATATAAAGNGKRIHVSREFFYSSLANCSSSAAGCGNSLNPAPVHSLTRLRRSESEKSPCLSLFLSSPLSLPLALSLSRVCPVL